MDKKDKHQSVIDYFKVHAIVRPRDLVQSGLPKHYLSQLVEDGKIIKLSRGLYQYAEQDISEWHSYLEVQQQVPKGIICLLSALVFHGITTQNPYEIWVATQRKTWLPNIDYPPVRYFSMSGDALTKGVEKHTIDGVELKVFSAAKTVADCFKYRNKVGLDVAVEALKTGWRQKKFTMEELMIMASVCRVDKVIRPYATTMSHS